MAIKLSELIVVAIDMYLSLPLALQINCRLLSFNFQSASMSLKLLSECQIALIRVRRRVTWRLIWLQAVCIWHYSCA